MARFLCTMAMICGLMGSCGPTMVEPEHVSDRGTVVYLTHGLPFYGIIDDHNRHWEPLNLPPDFQADSLRVQFDCVAKDVPSVNMWGQPMKLSSIKRLD